MTSIVQDLLTAVLKVLLIVAESKSAAAVSFCITHAARLVHRVNGAVLQVPQQSHATKHRVLALEFLTGLLKNEANWQPALNAGIVQMLIKVAFD